MNKPEQTLIENQLAKNYELTQAITHALSQFIAQANPYILFNGLLDSLLELTDSEYGFIGEVFYSNTGLPYIQSYATSNISWSMETRDLYEKTERQGLTFSKLNTLYGAILKTGKYVLSNDPANDPRSGGLPKGHPPLNTFLGVPFYSGETLLGVVGIANKHEGYEDSLVDYLTPFLETCGNLIQAYRNNQQKLQVEQELMSYKRRLAALVEKQSFQKNHSAWQKPITTGESNPTPIGLGYHYDSNQKRLLLNEEPVSLTRKESLMLELLMAHINKVVDHLTIESFVWKNVVVGESSLRALMLRLRRKIPGINIQTISGVGLKLITQPT